MCRYANLPIHFLCTGTRIRTQIKGVGDPYASRCTMPAKRNLLNFSKEKNSLGFNILKIYFKIYSKTEAISLLKNKVPKLFA